MGMGTPHGAQEVTAQQAGSAQVTSTASRSVGRVPGVTRYLHSQARVLPCIHHADTRRKEVLTW